MTTEIESIADRLRWARERLREVPVTDSHELGPPDEKTGERWDRFNVLGHCAEMLPFWSRAIGDAIAGDGSFGRPPGSAGRLEGIESGRLIGEVKLRDRIDAGVDTALALVARLDDATLDQMLNGTVRGPMTVREALEYYLVGHLEEHVGQLTSLP
ncbi:MAG: hypothetical protein NVS9B1_14960 [Candidatus Dormibacteraceae bacterium]